MTKAKSLTVRDLKRAAKAVGAIVEHDNWQAAGPLRENERWERYQVVAPHNFVWACDGSIHMLVVEWCTHFLPQHRHEAIEDALERIACGVEPCQDEDCDYCGED